MNIAFHNDPKVKEKAMQDMQAHLDADELVKGTYWSNGKGCFIGCAEQAYKKENEDWHDSFERNKGIERGAAYLFDSIFEGLPNNKAQQWPMRVYNAIEVGVDTSKITAKFVYWLLTDKNMVRQFADTKGKKAIAGVAKLYKQRIAGKEPTAAAWSAAESAAESAAWSAARSAAWSAARSAAESAAWSAAESAAESAAWSAAWSAAESAARSAAESAARSAAESAARSAARSACYEVMADKVIELLQSAPKA